MRVVRRPRPLDESMEPPPVFKRYAGKLTIVDLAGSERLKKSQPGHGEFQKVCVTRSSHRNKREKKSPVPPHSRARVHASGGRRKGAQRAPTRYTACSCRRRKQRPENRRMFPKDLAG